MSTKCKRPDHMHFGLDEGPYDVVVRDKPVMVQAFGLPDDVTIELFIRETDGTPDKAGCYDYCEAAIDPCTGAPAALSAASPMVVLNAGATYKMEVVGAEAAEIKDTVGVFCYELAGNVSLLLKKADAGGLSSADVKTLVEACTAPLAADIAANAAAIAAIPPDTDTNNTLVANPDGSITITSPLTGDSVTTSPPVPAETPGVFVTGPPVYNFAAGTATYPTEDDVTGAVGEIEQDISGLIALLTSTPHPELIAGEGITITGDDVAGYTISTTVADTDTDTRIACTFALVSGELVKTTTVINVVTGEPVGDPVAEVIPLPLPTYLDCGGNPLPNGARLVEQIRAHPTLSTAPNHNVAGIVATTDGQCYQLEKGATWYDRVDGGVDMQFLVQVAGNGITTVPLPVALQSAAYTVAHMAAPVSLATLTTSQPIIAFVAGSRTPTSFDVAVANNFGANETIAVHVKTTFGNCRA